MALLYSTGAAMAEAQQGCGFCASERAAGLRATMPEI